MESTRFILVLFMLVNVIQSKEDTAPSKIFCLIVRPLYNDHILTGDTDKGSNTKAWLVLRTGSDDEANYDSESVRFILKDNIQILWPGIQINDDTMDSWFVASVKHKENVFHMTTFLYQIPERTAQETIPSQFHHVSAAFTILTKTPVVRSKLQQDVFLDCTFSVDHQADVTVTWAFQKKGREVIKLVSYLGSTRSVQYHSKNVVMQEDKLPKGDASILVRNVDLESQGVYSCSVTVDSLYGYQKIHLEIVESPVVHVNAESLVLEEGEEKKLLCAASNYYPLDVDIEWLREDHRQSFLPIRIQNIMHSSHKHNIDGTYSISGFFMFRATPKDNGVIFTCRVEHLSLTHAIRKSVKITVTGSSRWSLEDWPLLALIALFIVILLYLAKYLYTGTNSSKPKPY
ncbi:tapasin-related protein-like isoform X2 [Pelobates fuscus]|uniref:tapasin-related protein-like isoform X2 n=1 Tax=Pelobates fuscus TaxID=191477 RepID=UPI002FE46642